jgi:hypothetical protein
MPSDKQSSIEEDTMNVKKLFEALSELRQQKSVIENAIRHLELAINALRGDDEAMAVAEFTAVNGIKRSDLRKVRHGSHLENVYSVLSKISAPLHVRSLQDYIQQKTGIPVTRASLEGAISRHIRTHKDKSLLVRVNPSTYALRNSPRIPIPPENGAEE